MSLGDAISYVLLILLDAGIWTHNVLIILELWK